MRPSCKDLLWTMGQIQSKIGSQCRCSFIRQVMAPRGRTCCGGQRGEPKEEWVNMELGETSQYTKYDHRIVESEEIDQYALEFVVLSSTGGQVAV